VFVLSRHRSVYRVTYAIKFCVKLGKVTIETNEMIKKRRMDLKKLTKSGDILILKVKNKNNAHRFV